MPDSQGQRGGRNVNEEERSQRGIKGRNDERTRDADGVGLTGY